MVFMARIQHGDFYPLWRVALFEAAKESGSVYLNEWREEDTQIICFNNDISQQLIMDKVSVLIE